MSENLQNYLIKNLQNYIDIYIVLEERSDGDIYVVTGYPVEYSHRRETFKRQYENYINSKDANSYKTHTK